MDTFEKELLKKYIDILWISYWLSLQEIQKIYKKKAMEYHPDRNHGFKEETEKKMKEINQAYDYVKKYYDFYYSFKEKSFEEMSNYEKIEYLGNLNEKDILSDEEFEIEKNKILWKNPKMNKNKHEEKPLSGWDIFWLVIWIWAIFNLLWKLFEWIWNL